jgi:hypothetical protein
VAAGVAAVVNAPVAVQQGDDDKPKLTEEQRQQRQRKNKGGRDDTHTEGDVTETLCDSAWPTVTIATRDGASAIRLAKGVADLCPSIRSGDYLEADGEKQDEQLFDADDITVIRSGHRIR